MQGKKLVVFWSTVFLLVAFLIGNAPGYEKEISGLSTSIGQRIGEIGKKKIAVVDFTDLQGNVTELGRFLAEELSVSMTMNFPNLEVIDRTHLKKLLEEHALSVSGLVDPSNVQKLGQIAGVEAIVTGSVTPFGDNVRVAVKVIATDTAKVIAADKADIAKTKAIEELLAKGIVTETRVEVKAQPGATPQAVVEVQAAPQATPKPTPRPRYVVESGILSFEYLGARRDGEWLIFDFLVTAKKDTPFRLYTGRSQRTRFILKGYEFAISAVQIGKEYSDYEAVNNFLVTNVPMRTFLFIKDANLAQYGFGKLELLEIVYSIDGGSSKEVVRFYNLKENPDRAWLGVYAAEVTPKVVEQLGMGTPRGALVDTVLRDSPAERAGLQKDDVILKVGEKEIASPDSLNQAVDSYRPGDRVRLEVWRNRQIFIFEVTFE